MITSKGGARNQPTRCYWARPETQPRSGESGLNPTLGTHGLRPHDAIGMGHPDEGLGAAIMLGEEPINCSLEVDERAEDAAFEAAARKP
jgi:hypothetical protein